AKPARAIKVIKAAKLTPPSSIEQAPTLVTTASVPHGQEPVKPPVDAFAEIASASRTDEEVVLEVPAPVTRKKEKRRTSKRAEIVAPRGESRVKKNPKETKSTTAKRTKKAGAPIAPPATVETVEVLGDETKKIAATIAEVEVSPVFKALAEVKLPELPRENRARLQMQSPTRLYFYWSLKSNPWQQLRAVFGADLGSYTLVLKLRDLTLETEEIHAVETEGEWWFNNVEPDSEYMAEIGFYATNRPYFRVLYSNTVTTPRRSPSPHLADEARWTVSATKFAEVLDASGFTRDAIDVAIAGDDQFTAKERTNLAFSDLMHGAEYSTEGIQPEDMRHALLALAGGATLADLRHRVSATLFDVLQSNPGGLSTSGARKALTEHFDIEEAKWTEHEFGSAVFGASLVNFPKTLKSRKDVKYSPRYNPVSSFSLGR
ncbi:MAG: DUF4912 domain-containing protein, partial [Acidobacteria bacterium]|nr:DUF4912 domain-containing protein [Acidobacteriota bacterium]